MDGKLAKIEFSSRMSYHVEQQKGDVLCFSILTDTRHKINHFVSTLQQYVQSQLSQVSWCSLPIECFICNLWMPIKFFGVVFLVEDMLDLESVHMLYLTESLRM
ncbi:uncharacterized protein [Primulina huaijiensis]|uniref:uncharacterized protein n=1 Tax=Primulina huaijiensis TaxID=1492673 RepID=UPI003CC7844D